MLRGIHSILCKRKQTKKVKVTSSHIHSRCLLPCGKMMPIWLAARERTSALIDRKCWDAVRAAVRARYWKQLFPGVVAFLGAMHTAASDGSHPWQWPVVHAAGGTGTWSTASGTTE